MIRDELNIVGGLTIQIHNATGELIHQVRASNDITLAGRNLVARLFNKDNPNVMRVTTISLGRSGAPFDPAATALGDKVGSTPIKSVEPSEVLDPVTGRKRAMLRITGELGENDCNAELQEAGLFTDDSIMYNRVVFGKITKTQQFKLTLIWEILF